MITLTTARIDSLRARTLSSKGGILLDITVRGGNALFCPTWEIVMGYKRGDLPWEEYSRQYRGMMLHSYRQNRKAWEETLSAAEGKTLVLLCYCPPPPANCHRHLLKGYLKNVAERTGHQVEVIPEEEPMFLEREK
jgi:hypothetical protein